ncbi:hypothetical protein ACHAPA_002854 [Fusarium lateritium]
MSNSRSSRRSNQIPYPYNTTLYVPVDCLSRTPSGRVYDPARGPVRPRTQPSRSSRSRRTRDRSSQSQAAQPQETQMFDSPPRELKLQVNNNFTANVRRVLGEAYVDLWNSLEELVEEMIEDHTRAGGRVILNRPWMPEELEKAARLQVWEVPDEVIENILGWPNRALTDEEMEQANFFLMDETFRLTG